MSEPAYESALELTAVEAWADRVEQIAFTLPDGCTLRDAVQWLAEQPLHKCARLARDSID